MSGGARPALRRYAQRFCNCHFPKPAHRRAMRLPIRVAMDRGRMITVDPTGGQMPQRNLPCAASPATPGVVHRQGYGEDRE